MILAGHQPNYLPYLGFFHKLLEVDQFVIVDNVQYVKRGPFGWISRNRIKTIQGPQWLTVPVLVKGKYEQEIKDVQINNSLPWGRKHWRSLLVNYGKAPCFKLYADFFEEIYTKREWKSLSELNICIILQVFEYLKLKKKIVKASDLKASGKGDELILDMCRKTGAEAYVHGLHGRDYIDPEKFMKANIRCLYQNFEHPVYRQQFGKFEPNLSVVDLLFNHGEESLDILSGKIRVNDAV